MWGAPAIAGHPRLVDTVPFSIVNQTEAKGTSLSLALPLMHCEAKGRASEIPPVTSRDTHRPRRPLLPGRGARSRGQAAQPPPAQGSQR